VSDLLLLRRYDFDFDLMPFHLRDLPLVKRLNLLKSGLNLIYRRLRPWSWPINMMIELTNYCNLRCPVCPTGNGEIERPPRAMELELFERLMNEVGPYLITAALFCWGEPLMHPRLSDALRIASKQRVPVRLSTNGQDLGDNRMIRALLDHPPAYLTVAIDGLTNETNSLYRVGADLELVLQGVRSLAEAKRQKGAGLPVLHMRFIAMKHNQHEIPQVRAFAAQHLFDLLTIRSLSIIDGPEGVHRELVPDEEAFRAYAYEGEKRVSRSDFICQEPFIFPTVFADGTVVACEQDFNATASYGRLSEGVSFQDIWFGERAKRIRRAIRDAPESFSFCRNCPFADRSVKTCSLQAIRLDGWRPPVISWG
jgi:radical SAM protein with 4Fe4S-binding SPASM domain